MIVAFHHPQRGYCILWDSELKRWSMNGDDVQASIKSPSTPIRASVAARFIKANCKKAVLPSPAATPAAVG